MIASIYRRLSSFGRLEKAMFGCRPGVLRTKVGYTGGRKDAPSYASMGDHTETVRLEFDPSKVSFKELLHVFWNNHDVSACQKNQYMSAIFCMNNEQKKIATLSKDEKAKITPGLIQTKILDASAFHDAEESLMMTDSFLKESFIAAKLNGYVGGYGQRAWFDSDRDELLRSGCTEEQLLAIGRCVSSA